MERRKFDPRDYSPEQLRRDRGCAAADAVQRPTAGKYVFARDTEDPTAAAREIEATKVETLVAIADVLATTAAASTMMASAAFDAGKREPQSPAVAGEIAVAETIASTVSSRSLDPMGPFPIRNAPTRGNCQKGTVD